MKIIATSFADNNTPSPPYFSTATLLDMTAWRLKEHALVVEISPSPCFISQQDKLTIVCSF